jgi:hypothetical protein
MVVMALLALGDVEATVMSFSWVTYSGSRLARSAARRR